MNLNTFNNESILAGGSTGTRSNVLRPLSDTPHTSQSIPHCLTHSLSHSVVLTLKAWPVLMYELRPHYLHVINFSGIAALGSDCCTFCVHVVCDMTLCVCVCIQLLCMCVFHCQLYMGDGLCCKYTLHNENPVS